MKHFPVFLNVEGRRIVVSGGTDAAVAKLRLLLKTEAHLEVYAAEADAEIAGWAEAGRLTLVPRALDAGDVAGALLVYGANEDEAEDARVAALGRAAGAQVNIVDNLQDSDFITPAIVDRDPVTVAIGTEGTAPVLARSIKASLEEQLSADLGAHARAAQAFRHAAEALPFGRARREFWAEFFATVAPREGDLDAALAALLARHLAREAAPGHVDFVGAGPGDPEHLTLKARRALDVADVVIHDRLVPAPILELVRREALLVEAGKSGFGKSMPQSEIDALIVEHAKTGAHVVRLKAGDPTVFGRLDEEIEACDAEGISWSIVPGITAASAAVAALGQSLTRRGRNSDVRLMTAHDANGFAEHDWAALARPGQVAAIYMGKRTARFLQGRLLMHGASPATPVSVVENAGRPGERIVATALGTLEPDLTLANVTGPALILLGLAPRRAAEVLEEAPHLREAAL